MAQNSLLHRTAVEAEPKAGYRQTTTGQQLQLSGRPGGIEIYMRCNMIHAPQSGVLRAEQAVQG
jgi:hypothetical protein